MIVLDLRRTKITASDSIGSVEFDSAHDGKLQLV
jgi:hypothetical protein